MTAALHSPAEIHAAKCELASDVLRSSGRLRLQVTGWSMLPAVWPSDILIIEEVASDSVHKGDIVLFGRHKRLFAHRVVNLIPGSQLLTRGDAMPSADPIVGSGELLGRVSLLERNGKFFAPKRRMGVVCRVIAGVICRSSVAARVLVGAHSRFRALQLRTS